MIVFQPTEGKQDVKVKRDKDTAVRSQTPALNHPGKNVS